MGSAQHKPSLPDRRLRTLRATGACKMSKGHSTGLHNNEKWLFDRFNIKKLSVGEIAKQAGVSEVSIYASIKKYKLKR